MSALILANHHCPTCGYDLTGLSRSGSLVSCPECGLLVHPGSSRRVSATNANTRLFLLMVGPMVVVTGACWLVSALAPDAARGPLYLPLIWAGSVLLPCVFVSLLWPAAVFLNITDPARPRPQTWRTALALLAIATTFNGAAVWLAGQVLHVGVVFS